MMVKERSGPQPDVRRGFGNTSRLIDKQAHKVGEVGP
jgi:hypothetical protein